MEKPIFNQDFYYHIINRGVDKRDVFLCQEDYVRFLSCLREFNSIEPIGSLRLKNMRNLRGLTPVATGVEPLRLEPLVEIICYCLNPNHFHLILKQLVDNGIPNFMRRVGGYTSYFNIKYKRSGALFQGRYKAFEIDDTNLLLEKTLYVNGNAEIHGIAKCDEWVWSSCMDFLNKRKGVMVNKQEIMQNINVREYQNLLFEYIREKKAWKKAVKEMEIG